MKFTDEQKNALEAKGRVLVSAAAGSGKTAVLVEKVINLITDENNPVDVDKLLVVTFTNAAAAEMKSRISKRLSEKIRENPENFNLKKQKMLLSSASICTIDSLCISLAREYFYKLGLPCDFKIADNSVLNKLQENCIDELLSENFEKADEEFISLVQLFGSERADEKIKENIFKTYEYLCSLPFPDEYIDKVNKLYTDFDENSVLFSMIFDYAYELLKCTYSRFKKAYDELLNEPTLLSGYGEAFAEINAKLVRAINFVKDRDYDGLRNMALYYTPAKLKAIRNYSDVDFREKMKSAKKTAEDSFVKLSKIFNSRLDDVFEDMQTLTPLINRFFALVKEYSQRLYLQKIESNSFGFQDIEAEVLKLLVEYKDGEVSYTDEAKELSSKYFAVMVDEYQDTNDLQNTIFNALSSNGQKLFMVGDVKQSIYGFRKANPKNFLACRNELPKFSPDSLKSKVIMSGNFRSCTEVCDFVNFLFYRLMSKRCGEMFYEEEDMLVPKVSFSPVDESRVRLDVITAEDEHSSSERQAHHIAKIIHEKVNKPVVTEDGSLRKAEYKDICILLRSRAEISVFRDILKQKNIPVWADDNEGLLLEKEIVTIFSLLQVIDNPFADVPLLSTLTSDIYNFTADEIAQIRAQSKDTELYRAVLSSASTNEKADKFIKEIEEFRSICAVSSVHSLINKILTKTGYSNTVYLYENGDLCYCNLLLFKEIAKSYEEGTQRGLSSFVSYINRQIKAGNTMQKAAMNGENDNAVRIMTMHRSKGLQFPICILACLNKKFNRADSIADVLLTEKCGLGLKLIDHDKKIRYSTLPRNAAVIESEAISQSEEMRLLYVAMTRAKDFLIMVGADSKVDSFVNSVAEDLLANTSERFAPYHVLNCDNFLKMILMGAICHTGGEVLRNIAQVKGAAGLSSSLEVNIIDTVDYQNADNSQGVKKVKFDKEKYKQLSEKLLFKYPYKDLNKIFVKQSASNLAHKEFSADFAFSSEPVFLRNQKLSPAQKGTAMHKFMQYCDFSAASQEVESEKLRLLRIGKLTQAEADSLKHEKLVAFFDSPIGKQVVNAEQVYKEQGFMIEVPAKDVYDDLGEEFQGENIIIQGFADLCFFDKDGLVIVDYKTDRADELELVKRYKTQLDVYALALSQVFECKVSKTAIYSFHNKKLIEL